MERTKNLATSGKLRSIILYFLGCFYYKGNDFIKSKEYLKECIEELAKCKKTKPPLKSSAKELLNHIWNYKMRPPWWRWWLYAPTFNLSKKIIFWIIIIAIVFAMSNLLSHPFNIDTDIITQVSQLILMIY